MPIRIIGLTGGIASGKTTVSTHLRSLGATVLCADTLYHELIRPKNGAPSPLAEAINRAFPEVLLEDGSLDRAALGQRVFGDPEQLNLLGGLTHPAIKAEAEAQIERLEQDGLSLVFYDAPLLFERQLQSMVQGVVVVWLPRPLQLERLLLRSPALSEEEGEQRLNSQMPLDEKRRLATWVIDNSGALQTTRQQTEALFNTLAT